MPIEIPDDVIGTVCQFLTLSEALEVAKTRGSYPKQVLLNFNYTFSNDITKLVFNGTDCRCLINNRFIDKDRLLEHLIAQKHNEDALYVAKKHFANAISVLHYVYEKAAFYGNLELLKLLYINKKNVEGFIVENAFKGLREGVGSMETVTWCYENAWNDNIRIRFINNYKEAIFRNEFKKHVETD